jgi:transcriptional regulator with XRE-family HTH domain
MRDINKLFGIAVRERRKARGLSQEALADKAGLHRNSLGEVERAEVAVSLEVAYRIASALGCRLSDLLREVERG